MINPNMSDKDKLQLIKQFAEDIYESRSDVHDILHAIINDGYYDPECIECRFVLAQIPVPGHKDIDVEYDTGTTLITYKDTNEDWQIAKNTRYVR
jgi:hypothetical protein